MPRTPPSPEGLRYSKNLIFYSVSFPPTIAWAAPFVFVFPSQPAFPAKLPKYCSVRRHSTVHSGRPCSDHAPKPLGSTADGPAFSQTHIKQPGLATSTYIVCDGFTVIAIRSLGTPPCTPVASLKVGRLQPNCSLGALSFYGADTTPLREQRNITFKTGALTPSEGGFCVLLGAKQHIPVDRQTHPPASQRHGCLLPRWSITHPAIMRRPTC